MMPYGYFRKEMIHLLQQFFVSHFTGLKEATQLALYTSMPQRNIYAQISL